MADKKTKQTDTSGESPSILNQGALRGGWWGALLAAATIALAETVGYFTDKALDFAEATSGMGAAVSIGLAVIAAAMVVTGAYVGGKTDQRKQEIEQEQAQQKPSVPQIAKAKPVSQEIARPARAKPKPEKEWAKMQLQAKLLATIDEHRRQ